MTATAWRYKIHRPVQMGVFKTPKPPTSEAMRSIFKLYDGSNIMGMFAFADKYIDAHPDSHIVWWMKHELFCIRILHSFESLCNMLPASIDALMGAFERKYKPYLEQTTYSVYSRHLLEYAEVLEMQGNGIRDASDAARLLLLLSQP